MILRYLPRQQALLQVTSTPTKTFSSPVAQHTQRRFRHFVPELRHGERFRNNGVKGFLSPQGYNFSWLQYQDSIVQNLNRLTVDTPLEALTPKELLIHTSRWSEKAAIFNHASMAFNNQFFFDCLHPDAPKVGAGSKKEDLLPRELVADIANSFSSLETLRLEMIKTANAMFGPGFVWVVKDTGPQSMKVLTTYIAGTPFPAAHARKQPVDMNTVTTNVIGRRSLTTGDHNKRLTEVQNSVGSFGAYSRGEKDAPMLGPGINIDLEPILCVKVWEHGWLYDYGIGPRSKSLYLERWWESIDWDHVYQKTVDMKPSTSLGDFAGLRGLGSAFRRSPYA